MSQDEWFPGDTRSQGPVPPEPVGQFSVNMHTRKDPREPAMIVRFVVLALAGACALAAFVYFNGD